MDNAHFSTAAGWSEARDLLMFDLLEPGDTAGCTLSALRIHVRDHKLRPLEIKDRTLEAHYGDFLWSQAFKGAEQARRLASEVSYGRVATEARIGGCEVRVYEAGPEPAPDDIDGRHPAVAVWHRDGVLYLLASHRLSGAELLRIAGSLRPIRRAIMDAQ
jgi:hypothetical protein